MIIKIMLFVSVMVGERLWTLGHYSVFRWPTASGLA
jgi:hypothetical protein